MSRPILSSDYVKARCRAYQEAGDAQLDFHIAEELERQSRSSLLDLGAKLEQALARVVELGVSLKGLLTHSPSYEEERMLGVHGEEGMQGDAVHACVVEIYSTYALLALRRSEYLAIIERLQTSRAAYTEKWNDWNQGPAPYGDGSESIPERRSPTWIQAATRVLDGEITTDNRLPAWIRLLEARTKGDDALATLDARCGPARRGTPPASRWADTEAYLNQVDSIERACRDIERESVVCMQEDAKICGGQHASVDRSLMIRLALEIRRIRSEQAEVERRAEARKQEQADVVRRAEEWKRQQADADRRVAEVKRQQAEADRLAEELKRQQA